MEKPVRKAVRCYLIKDEKVAVIKYNKDNKKSEYYDIPGGKIENGETSKQTAIREMREETGLEVKNLRYKGKMIIEYPDRIIDFDVFISNEYEGELKEAEENIAEWIEINSLLQKEKILSCILILNSFFIKGLINDNCNFEMNIEIDEEENILSVNYKII